MEGGRGRVEGDERLGVEGGRTHGEGGSGVHPAPRPHLMHLCMYRNVEGRESDGFGCSKWGSGRRDVGRTGAWDNGLGVQGTWRASP